MSDTKPQAGDPAFVAALVADLREARRAVAALAKRREALENDERNAVSSVVAITNRLVNRLPRLDEDGQQALHLPNGLTLLARRRERSTGFNFLVIDASGGIETL